jgi:hypothetical protein
MPKPLFDTVTGDRRPNSDGRVGHHDIHELEHHLRQTLAGGEHELLARPLHLRQRDGEDDREEHDLKHLVLRGSVEEALRNRMLDHARQRGVRARVLGAFLRRRRAEVDANAGFDQVDGKQADRQRQRRHDLEVDDRAERQSADTLHIVAVARDADDERRKQQRHDQRFDHPQKDG